jgi:hypothetical protein
MHEKALEKNDAGCLGRWFGLPMAVCVCVCFSKKICVMGCMSERAFHDGLAAIALKKPPLFILTYIPEVSLFSYTKEKQIYTQGHIFKASSYVFLQHPRKGKSLTRKM